MEKVYLVKVRINDFERTYDKVVGIFTDPVLAEKFSAGYKKKMLEFKNMPKLVHSDNMSEEEIDDAEDLWLHRRNMSHEFNSIWIVDDDKIVLNPDIEKFFL